MPPRLPGRGGAASQAQQCAWGCVRPPPSGGIAQSERSALGSWSPGSLEGRAQRISFLLPDDPLPQTHTHLWSHSLQAGPVLPGPSRRQALGFPRPCSHLRLTWGGSASETARGEGRFISCGCRVARLADLLTMAAYVIGSARYPQNESAQSWKI